MSKPKVPIALEVSDLNIGNVDVLSTPPLPAGTNNIGDVDVATLPAGELHIGSVGQHSTKITGAIQRPNDTTTYAARDVIGTAVSANVSLADVARVAGGGGTIFKTRVITDANKSLKPTLELWLFDTPPANIVDNAPFAPTDAEMLTVQAVIPLSSGYVGNPGADASGNYILISDTAPFVFKCTALVRSLTAILVITNAYIPVAQETFTIILDTMQN